MKIILHLSRFAWRVLLACLVATALALSVVRFWLLPRAAEWREELQANISQMIGETVQIKSLSAGMRGFKPELIMRGFRIENAAGGPPLEFQRLGVGLDMVDSFLTRSPVIDRIELEGARLRLFRQANGTISVAGLKPGEHPPAWLFAEGEVRFSDIDLEWADGESGPAMPLGRGHVRLRNQGNRHVLDARLDLLGKLGKSMRLSAEIDGNPMLPAGWNGRAYLEAKRIREGAFAESLKLRMRSGEAGFQAWGQWRDGVLQDASGKFELDRPVFNWRRGTDRPDAMLILDKLSGWLDWHKEGDGWRLDVQHLNLAQKGKPWPETHFALAMAQAPDGTLQNLRAAVGYLRLDDALALLGSLPVLDDSDRETLKSWSPRGEVRDARLVYQADGHFGFCGELLGLAVNLTADRPGLNHFNGHLCGNDRDGQLDLYLAKSELNLPGLFPKPLAIDTLSGNLAWSRSGGKLSFAELVGSPANAEFVGPTLPVETPSPFQKLIADSAWRIVGNRIQLTAPGLKVSGGFALERPAGEGQSPTIELDAHLREVDATRLRDYLPTVAMDPETAKWHSNAYRDGKFPEADVLLRGRVADYPFPNGEGLFEAHVTAENLELEFNPQWPHAFGLNAKILLFGPTMFIDTVGGRVGDLPLKPARSETASLIGNARMSMSSDFDIELAHALKFLQQTPVRHIPQRLAKAFDASGPAHLDLQLDVPLVAGEIGIKGLLQLKSDSLSLKGANLKVHDLTGELNINENGLAGKQISGRAMDEPILIDVDQQKDDILLDVTGKTSVPALRKVFPGDWWRHVEGSFDYRLNLQVPKSLDPTSAPMRIDLASNLDGLELQFPAPLVKSPSQQKDFSASLNFRRVGHSVLRLAYGSEGRARLLFASSGDGLALEGGDVFWGKPQVPADGSPGLGLYLKLASLDLGQWRKLLAEFGGGSGTVTPRAFDVEIDKFAWDGEGWGSLRLTGNRQDNILAGEVDCQYARGIYTLENPHSDYAALKMELDILNLPKQPDEPEKPSPPNPASLPTLQIHARQFMRNGAPLGELELETERWTAGMNIKQLNLRTPNHDLRLKGGWMRHEGQDETRVDGRLNVHDLGSFLTLLGFSKEILATPTESTFSLHWQGAPQQFSAAALAGEVHLKMGRGSVPQVDPGLGRALSMLNLPTLRRLLMLDFSDIFGKGLSYDSMAGSFKLEAGQARTQGFVIDAAAADILVIGRVGLSDQDFDQIISVLPHPLASIPLAVPMFGGAAVGAVIDMAHRLAGEEAVNLASSNYAVTGTWDNPQFKRVQGSTPVEIVERTWNRVKGMSGMGSNEAGGQE